MKIAIDRDLCEGNAVCVKLAPEMFRVGDDDVVQVLGEITAENAERIAKVVGRCPRGALTLVPADASS